MRSFPDQQSEYSLDFSADRGEAPPSVWRVEGTNADTWIVVIYMLVVYVTLHMLYACRVWPDACVGRGPSHVADRYVPSEAQCQVGPVGC